MTDFVSLLVEINPAIQRSDVADWQFKDAQEAIVFAHWTGALLPFGTGAGEFFQLPTDPFDGGNVVPLFAPDITAMFDERWLNARKYVFVRRLKNPRRRYSDYNDYFSETMDEVVRKGIRPEEVVIWHQHHFDLKGADDEAFWEYMAGIYFREKGFLVTRWCPADVPGVPDLCAYRLPTANTALRRAGLMGKGAFLFELDLWKVFGTAMPYRSGQERAMAIVIEAESASKRMSQGIRQLIDRGTYHNWKPGYLSEGHFDEGFVSGPGYPVEPAEVGLISNTEDYHLYVSPCKKNFAREETKQETLEELERVLKLFLCRSLDVEQLSGLLSRVTLSKCPIRDVPTALYQGLEHVSLDTICQRIAGG